MAPRRRIGRTRSHLRERGVLALGLTSAAALAVAAFLPVNDPEFAGRTALAQLATRTEQAVVAEWESMRRDPRPIALRSSEVFRSVAPRSGDSDAVIARDPAAAPPADEDVAAGALLSEAERADVDAKTALELVQEALQKHPSARQRAQAHLAAIQLALRASNCDLARQHLAEALAHVDPHDDAADDFVLRALLAALPCLPNGGPLDAATNDLAARWCLREGREHPPRIERLATNPPYFALEGGSRLIAMCDRLRALPWSRAVREVVETAPSAAAAHALEDFVAAQHADGRAPSAAIDTDAWSLLPVGDDFLARFGGATEGATRAPPASVAGRSASQVVDALGESATSTPRSPESSWTGFLVTRGDLVASLTQRLRDADLLPRGVALDFDGARDDLGRAWRERVALPGTPLAFVLRHRDPDELVRGDVRRQAWLRIALFALALLAAGAGTSMSRALRRERMLAELKTSFVANVSHELRTPLASILLLAENLESGRAVEPATQARYHALIRREALRLARLVDDVLDFSRLERGQQLDVRLEEVAGQAVVDDWCADARTWATQHAVQLSIDVGEVPDHLSIDREALRRALFNLLDNARKHSGSTEVSFAARRVGGAFVLRVADRGRGIPHAKRTAIFEPFERLDTGPNAAPGTGLGLAIVKEIVLAHHGTIAVVDSDDGPGAVFEIRLPLVPAETDSTRGGPPGTEGEA